MTLPEWCLLDCFWLPSQTSIPVTMHDNNCIRFTASPSLHCPSQHLSSPHPPSKMFLKRHTLPEKLLIHAPLPSQCPPTLCNPQPLKTPPAPPSLPFPFALNQCEGCWCQCMFPCVQDSLTPLAQYMQQALGSDHAVSSIMQRLADANLSKATKARQQEQQKLQQVMQTHMDMCMAVNRCHNNICRFLP